MTVEGVHRLFELLDGSGAGWLAPERCRRNIEEAERRLAPQEPEGLHFAECPLLGEPGIDMTWGVSSPNMAGRGPVPADLEVPALLATKMAEDSCFLVEYDTSASALPAAGFYFSGLLADGKHAIGEMMRCMNRGAEARAMLTVAASLASMRYSTTMCGVMAGRQGAPVRVIAKARGELYPGRLVSDLGSLRYQGLDGAAVRQVIALCRQSVEDCLTPLVHVDVNPDGSLGPTLGVEVSGIGSGDAADNPYLRMALDWGLADERWEDLRNAAPRGESGPYLEFNTLKFRWRGGEPLPAKMYMRACW